MKEFLRVCLWGAFFSLISFGAQASVSFITGDDSLQFNNSLNFNDKSPDTCKALGYNITTCPGGNLIEVCPYNSAYFKECCDASYNYTKSQCAAPKTISNESCGGKYKCYCNKSVYKVSSCVSPQVPEGIGCSENGVTYYTKCTCPSNYNQTCNGLNQQGVGKGCVKNGVTYYTSCQCKSGYNMTCSDLGPVTPSNYCLMNGIKYYNNCKTCEYKCSSATCPVGMNCNYEDCSQKYCMLGCLTGYIGWCTKPETDCAKLGYVNSVSECGDYPYMKCPYNTAAVFCDFD